MNSKKDAVDSISKEKGMRASLVAGICDTLITGLAFVMASSSVLLADFLKTFIEMLAIFLSWMAMRRINKGADNSFEYGVGKLENISSIIVGMVMMLSVFIIAGNAVRNLIHPSHVQGIGLWVSIVGQGIYLLINGREALKNRRLAKEYSSPLFHSQARLFTTRFIGNFFIMAAIAMSMSLQHFTWAVYIDPISSLVIAASIMIATIGIFTSSFFDLLDRTLDEEHQIVILKELAAFFHEYEGLHGIRSRRSGGRFFIEIFLEFSPDKKVGQVQEVTDSMRRNIENKIRGSSVTIGLSKVDVK
ncbi:MAG: cation diffusion facilitator family transporter [Victivallales bacterium]